MLMAMDGPTAVATDRSTNTPLRARTFRGVCGAAAVAAAAAAAAAAATAAAAADPGTSAAAAVGAEAVDTKKWLVGRKHN
jgi:hypothetical protein